MPIKMSNGNYKCPVCGKKYRNYKKAGKHERNCGVQNLSEYMDGKEINLGTESFETTDTKQLKLGEKPVGQCGQCESMITEDDIYNIQKSVYECSKCKNLVLINNAES